MTNGSIQLLDTIDGRTAVNTGTITWNHSDGVSAWFTATNATALNYADADTTSTDLFRVLLT